MVARKGRIIYSDAIGFQDKGANTPMKVDSIFRVYSMTKPLASVAALARAACAFPRQRALPQPAGIEPWQRGGHFVTPGLSLPSSTCAGT